MTFRATELKPKVCKHCEREFAPVRPLQAVCSPVCASRLVKAERKEQAERDKARKQSFKTIPQLIKETQSVFNAYIRERDALRPCICCGRTETDSGGLRGHGWDAGHYRSTGSASHLRFNEDNVHRQLVLCNRHGAGRAVDYRIGLIARIGLARVEALEADNEPHKWTREELEFIKNTYRQKLKELKSHG